MNYSLLERTCCALVWVAHCLRQYMLNYTTWLVSKMDPVKYIFEKPTLTDTDSNLLVRFRIHTQLSRCSMPNACADLLIQHSISVSIFFMPLFVVFLHLLCLHVCLCPPKCCFGSHFVSSVITLEESMAVRLGCCAFVMI